MMKMTREHGFSLIELMISMTIGIFLIGGAIYVYDEARSTLRVNDTLARMQEDARWALDIIEPDLRLSGYWGRHASGAALAGRAGTPSPLAVGVANDCGPNWSINTNVSLEAFNNVRPTWACLGADDYVEGTDTLALRHASGRIVDTAELEGGRIYLRTHENGRGALFAGALEPAIVDAQNHALIANAYYVRPNTIGADGRPSLRRRGLTVVGGVPTVVDQEIIAGVEDLQVQFGIDASGDCAVDRYVDPDNPVLATNPRVRALRIWLRIRGDQSVDADGNFENVEAGFSDARTYRYADREYTPAGDEARFRRLLVSRTIFLRNESIPEDPTRCGT